MPGRAEEAGQLNLSIDGGGLGNAVLHQGTGVEIGHKERRDVVEQDRDDHLICVVLCLEIAGNGGPDAAGQNGQHKAKRQPQRRGHAGEGGPKPAGGDGPHDELPLRAQVQHAAAIGEDGSKAGEDQRRRLDQCLAPGLQAAEGAPEKVAIGGQRVTSGGGNDHRAEGQGEDDGQHGHDDLAQQVGFGCFHKRSSISM